VGLAHRKVIIGIRTGIFDARVSATCVVYTIYTYCDALNCLLKDYHQLIIAAAGEMLLVTNDLDNYLPYGQTCFFYLDHS
jgi:hypothetical protein